MRSRDQRKQTTRINRRPFDKLKAKMLHDYESANKTTKIGATNIPQKRTSTIDESIQKHENKPKRQTYYYYHHHHHHHYARKKHPCQEC